jgi:TatD DNase family protein
MVRSDKTRDTIAKIPRDMVLTETDGPFIEMESRQIVPGDIQIAEDALAETWGTDSSVVRNTVMQNYQRLMEPLKQSKRIEAGGGQEIKSV